MLSAIIFRFAQFFCLTFFSFIIALTFPITKIEYQTFNENSSKVPRLVSQVNALHVLGETVEQSYVFPSNFFHNKHFPFPHFRYLFYKGLDVLSIPSYSFIVSNQKVCKKTILTLIKANFFTSCRPNGPNRKNPCSKVCLIVKLYIELWPELLFPGFSVVARQIRRQIRRGEI